MDKLFFMRSVITAMSEGGFFRRVFAIALKCVAVLTAVGALAFWISMWIALSRAPSPPVVIGVMLFQIVFAVTAYCVFHAIWIRSDDISALSDSEYTMIPIVSVFAKLIGETSACWLVGLGVATGLLLCVGGDEVSRMGQALPTQFGSLIPISAGGVLGGLMTMVQGAVAGFLLLVIFYFISEQLRVIADIAINTRPLRAGIPAPVVQQPVVAAAGPQPAQPAAPPPPPPPPPEDVICPNCSTSNEKTAYFCAKCGFRLGSKS